MVSHNTVITSNNIQSNLGFPGFAKPRITPWVKGRGLKAHRPKNRDLNTLKSGNFECKFV